ncbi:MAG: acyl-CoA thioesterase [Deltaproteobacteria bacterium]|jgi:acyl-CoA thioester hydrolase|nr:acyl-CoA thioesterase [Deltaproteobacteria bacterium]
MRQTKSPDASQAPVSTSWYRVLYVDTDTMGIVNNGHYFRFFELARNDFLRHLGLPYSEVERRGVRTPLTEAGAHFFAPFHYDDLIRIECWISQVKRASFRFEYLLFLEGGASPRVSGHTVHATLAEDLRVVKIPDWLRETICPADAGQPGRASR